MDIGLSSDLDFTVEELEILSDILAEHREQAREFLTQTEWAELMTLQEKIDDRLEELN